MNLQADEDEERPRARRRITEAGDDDAGFGAGEGGDLAEVEDDEGYLNLDDYKGPVREWLALEAPQREVRRRFRNFLSDYKSSNGIATYANKINLMCSDNRQSLEVGTQRHTTAALS